MLALIEFDAAKESANRAKHGINLASFEEFDLENALVGIVDRHTYGEVRYVAVGTIGDRLYTAVFTLRGKAYRVSSLRPAHRKERKRYEEAT